MKRWFLSASVKTKIIGATMAILLAVVAVNYVVFIRGYAADAERAMVEKAAAFTAVADEAKKHASKLMLQGAVDTETLIAEAQEAVKNGQGYETTRFFQAIPVVVGWTTAGEAAEKEHIDFSVLAFEARNRKNEPAKGSFEEALLRDLEAEVKRGGDQSLARVNQATNTLHYMRAIALDASCMMCHGTPGGEHDPDKDGKDPLGFPMEGWAVGATHGAYQVAIPLNTMDARIAAFFQNGMMFCVPLIVGAGLGFAWLTRAMVARPLGRVLSIVTRVADGDLTSQPMNMAQRDEIGRVADGVDKMQESLKTLVRDTQRTAGEVASAASEIAASSEQTASGMRAQSAQTDEASAAIAEMAASVHQVAAKSESGRGVVQRTVEEMNLIASQAADSASAVTQLGRKGEEIGKIVGVINDIADQTNLLALNAAIEAARAGEHGRGFAVVADEVRKLAERTTHATKEIADSISGIQTETSAVVSRMESGAKKVAEGVSLAQAAGQALAEIVAATSEQASASEQISRNMEKINAVTKESTEGASQAASAATELSASAEQLQSVVGRFRL